MDKLLVSWLMPIYNGGKYLRRALDSMLNQTMQNFDIIIIVEYGCIDDTSLICEEYSKKDTRVKVYHNQEKLGITKSLNYGLELCKGKYIARMDADDYSYPERLEKQVAFMEVNPDVGILCTNRRIICNNGITYNNDPPTDPEEIRVRLLFAFCLNHPTMMLRTDLFKINNWKYPENGEAEDYALCASLFFKTSIACLSEVLLDYYEHGENAIFAKFDTVRAASADISRNAIFITLGVDTKDYADIYFGWCENDIPPYDIKTYLFKGVQLLKEIYNANERMLKFNSEILRKALLIQWKKITCLAGFSSFLNIEFDKVTLNIIEDAISNADSLFSSNAKVIIYGTGYYCKEILSYLNGEYPFDLLFFCDSSQEKQETIFFDRKIISPKELPNINFDYILIASPLYESEIKRFLIEDIGLSSQKTLALPSINALDFFKKRNRYDKYYAHNGTERRVYLFCAPDYGNLGDHSIAVAEHNFFKEKFAIEIAEVPLMKYSETAVVVKHHILPSDIVLITGGGFLGSLWFSAEQQARDVIKNYPNNPIIILPQSIFWEKTPRWKKECEETQQVYASHGNLTLCARDPATYKLMQELYPTCHLLLMPDMALYMNWNSFFDTDTLRNGTLLCLKKDEESILTDENHQYLLNIGKKLCGEAKFCNTDLLIPISQEERESKLREKINEFRKAELVVTDRLHGMIFAAVAETPCVALNGLTHKLQATFEWVKHLPYMRFAENIADVETFASQVLTEKNRKYETARLASYFDELNVHLSKVCKFDMRDT